MTINLDDIFKNFCEKLSKRTGILTEDNVRYYWFAAMYEKDHELDHYTFEYPYMKAEVAELSNKELDLLYKGNSERWFFEIKFHRNVDTNSAYAHTDAAGALFNDMLRLQTIKCKNDELSKGDFFSARYFFLYVTDDEMYNYLTTGRGCKGSLNINYREKLKEFIELEKDSEVFVDFKDITLPKTFVERALASFVKKEEATLKKDLIKIQNIQLCQKEDTLRCNSESFKGNNRDKPFYVRLYEIV